MSTADESLDEPLYYRFGDTWYPVPAWTDFYYQVGLAVGEHAERLEEVITAVLLVPTRAFAAAFAAAGVIHGRFQHTTNSAESANEVSRISTLAPGSPVRLYRDNMEYQGIFEGLKELEYGTFLSVRLSSTLGGAESRLIPVQDADCIEPIENGIVKLEKRKKVRKSKTQNEFVERFFGALDVASLGRKTQRECVIAGRIGLLKHEIVSTQFGYSDGDDDYYAGCLQDIIRAKRFLPPGKPFRSTVYAGDKAPPEMNHDNNHLPVVIFDGARAFVTGYGDYNKHSMIIIVDQTDRYIADAVDGLRLRTCGIRKPGRLPGLRKLPAGVELCVRFNAQ